jgi:hypothetical protein
MVESQTFEAAPDSNGNLSLLTLHFSVPENGMPCSIAPHRHWARPDGQNGMIMSGCRPLIKGYFGVALVVGAVMSSAFCAENRIRWP